MSDTIDETTNAVDLAMDAETRNRQAERDELRRWANAPGIHVAYFFPLGDGVGHSGTQPYRDTFWPSIRDAVVTTWLGTRLGVITSAKVTTGILGRLVSMRVTGTNGARYYGRASWDNGNVITLRKLKDQTR